MAGPMLYHADGSYRVTVVNTEAPVSLTGNLVVDTLGAVDDTKVTDPDAASATIPALLRGLLELERVGYETVAASQTAQVLGSTGAAGDYLAGLLIVPASVSPGNVILLDNAVSITVFAGGTNSLTELRSFYLPFGLKSASGAWKVTTGANVSVVGMGLFT